MKCRNPEKCRNEVLIKQALLEKDSKKVEAILSKIRKRYASGDKTVLTMTEHAHKRCVYRAVSTVDVVKVFKEGQAIEYSPGKSMCITLMGYTRENRPIHIVLASVADKKDWKIVTVYDPRTEAWRWEENYTKKVCFCSV